MCLTPRKPMLHGKHRDAKVMGGVVVGVFCFKGRRKTGPPYDMATPSKPVQMLYSYMEPFCLLHPCLANIG